MKSYFRVIDFLADYQVTLSLSYPLYFLKLRRKFVNTEPVTDIKRIHHTDDLGEKIKYALNVQTEMP